MGKWKELTCSTFRETCSTPSGSMPPQVACSRKTTTSSLAPIRLPSCLTITSRDVLHKIRKSSNLPHHQQPYGHSHLPDRECGRSGLHRHRARQGGRHLPPRNDALGDVFSGSRKTTTSSLAPIRLPSCLTITSRDVLHKIRKSSGEPSASPITLRALASTRS